jgi:hypothetical protein
MLLEAGKYKIKVLVDSMSDKGMVSCFIDIQLLIVTSHGGKSEGGLRVFHKGTNPIHEGETPPHPKPITSQKLHFLILSQYTRD